jgi:hypothetical protein
MMHTDSEQTAIDIMNAMNVNTGNQVEKREDKATRRETRYEKWKRTRKAKRGLTNWCCCLFKPQNSDLDTTPLTTNNSTV